MEDLTESEIQGARDLADKLDKSAKCWVRQRWLLPIVAIGTFGVACWIWWRMAQSIMAFPEHLIDSPSNPPIDHLLLLSQLRYEFISFAGVSALSVTGASILSIAITRWNRDKKDRLLGRIIHSHLALLETDRDRSST